MQIEQLTLALRPRSNWEAVDLGMRMVVGWAKPIYAVWFAFVVPFALLCFCLGAFAFDSSFWGLFVYWLLKPAYDRIALHVLSHSVFGDTPSVKSTRRALFSLFKQGSLFFSITLGRFSMRRTLVLPVRQLEMLTGKQARKRCRLISSRASGTAFWLLIGWVFVVFCLWVGVLGLMAFFMPESFLNNGSTASFLFDLIVRLRNEWSADYWKWFFLLWVICDVLLEPFYVAAGFALYLKRRTELEAWDVEMQMRQIASEGLLKKLSSGLVRAMPLLFGAVLLLGAMQPSASMAATPDREAAAKNSSETLKKVLSRPEFPQTKKEKVWVNDPVEQKEPEKTPEKAQESSSSEGIFSFLQGIGGFFKVIAWGILAVIVGAIAWAIFRNIGAWKSTDIYVPPAQISGMDIRPESLPDDVASAALALAKKGQTRAALSLLFRASLSVLAHRDHIPFASADTEEDCLARVEQSAQSSLEGFFRELTRTWQNQAYAHRNTDIASIEKICMDWRTHFSNVPVGEVK